MKIEMDGKLFLLISLVHIQTSFAEVTVRLNQYDVLSVVHSM